MVRSLLLLGALFPCQLFAQPLHAGFGVKGGVRATDDINGTFVNSGTLPPARSEISSDSSRGVAGPMVEAALPHGFGVEVDALYYRPESTYEFFNAFARGTVRASGSSWEFPMVIKYGLPFPRIRPYAELGYALRRCGGSVNGTGNSVDAITGSTREFNWNKPWPTTVSHGWVAGIGADASFGKLRIAPEVRYTRWNEDVYEFTSRGGMNQVQVLVGVSWWPRR